MDVRKLDAMSMEEKMRFLIAAMQEEMPEYSGCTVPEDADGQWRLVRSLFNVRPPMPASTAFLAVQDSLLQAITAQKGVADAAALCPVPLDERLFLWQGDITTLRADAIVNAANSRLLGCWRPLHSCIDNCIHTMSGVQLRLKCHEIMRAQGHEEATGTAKITPGYNLPAKYVLHTVGPIVDGLVTPEHERLLAGCYRSCLDLAEENGCRSIAFCCISTGVFMFPAQRAAQIAVQTVRGHLDSCPGIRQVIFNVFRDEDRTIYEHVLGRTPC